MMPKNTTNTAATVDTMAILEVESKNPGERRTSLVDNGDENVIAFDIGVAVDASI